jgi:RNA polymerase sigma-70 factor (ECF subfamily)
VTRRPTDIAESLAVAIGTERLRIVAGLIRVTGDWDLAEDCVQDAVERALATWPRDGVPDNPAAWLTTAAHRRALDILRRRRTEADKMRRLASLAEAEQGVLPDPEVDPYPNLYRDDRLRLLFTCCHPALPLAGQVALTLRTVGGLTTAQIAQAFLVTEPTMAQRLLRTRNKISHTGISFKVPEPHRIGERTAGVLAVVYLIFNQGYAITDDQVSDGLAAEAIRLAELLTRLLPADDEVLGLAALLLLQHARRATRVDQDGELMPMPDQDRARWDRQMVRDGLANLIAARETLRPAGYYRLQAEIAAEHATAPAAELTDWGRIVTAYDALLMLQQSPIIALNRTVALGFRDGPEAGLSALDEVAGDPRLAGYHLLPAARADLLRRAGRGPESVAAYRDALDLVRTETERRFLQRRIDEVSGPAA